MHLSMRIHSVVSSPVVNFFRGASTLRLGVAWARRPQLLDKLKIFLAMGASKDPAPNATQHPHNVQPWGNYLFAQGKDTRNAGE